MKMLSLVSLILLATTVFSMSARGDEPETHSAVKLTPQMQAMLAELLKAADMESVDPTPAAPPAPATTSPAAASSALRPLKTSLGSTALRTGSLRTGRLGVSGSLTGAPRLNDDEWRQLFPTRK